MKLALVDFNQEAPMTKEKVSLTSFKAISALSDTKPRADIISRVVDWQLAKRRSGTSKVKNRGEVKASTRKIYRQKGTGNARHGARSSNLFRGGGRSFGPTPRSYYYPLNKKIRRLGLYHALAYCVNNKSLFVMTAKDLDNSKTSSLKKRFDSLGFTKALIVAPKDSLPNMRLAARNIIGLDFLAVEGANVYDFIRHKQVILWQDSLADIEKRIIIGNLEKFTTKPANKESSKKEDKESKAKVASAKKAAPAASAKKTVTASGTEEKTDKKKS